MPYEWVGKALQNDPTIMKVKGDNYFYFQSIVYLLTYSEDQHFAFRQSLCDYVADEYNNNNDNNNNK